ncbi:relaxase MobL [Lactococcus taiwanensis]|uniref:relaxase MobL n=1 Tax=Lactococcus taiwanensis TaxID=1151742 RepID=UPI0035184A9A
MRDKKVGTASPEIIVTSTFETATSTESFARYVDYSDREAAVLVDRVEEAFDNHLESAPDFEKMIGYMKREAAILNKDEKRTGLFTENSNNISAQEMQALKEKLHEAQMMGNNLWNPVISFDVAYLIRVGILKYNPELEAKIDRLDKVYKAAEKERPKHSKKIYQAKKALEVAAKQRIVDQERLKAVVQANMNDFLKREGFDDNVFWWGSVHLNTKHIHIHLSFSEVKTSRKIMEVEKEINGKIVKIREPRGKLKERNIKYFKSKLYHSLELPKERALKIRKEVEVGKHRQAILEQVTNFPQISLLNFYLEETARHLPQEGQLNYASNRKEFRVSKAYLTAFVEEYLRTIGKKEYEAFTQATRRQLSDYESTYSKAEKFDLEKLVEKRQRTLKNALANRMLKELKHFTTEHPEERGVDFLNTKELEQVVEDLKRTKVSSYELGKYKWLLKVSYAEAEEQKFKKKLRQLEQIEEMQSNKPLKQYYKKQFERQVQLAQFEQKTNFQLTENEKALKVALKLELMSARNFPINESHGKVLQNKFQELEKEMGLLAKTKDKHLIQIIYGTNQSEALRMLEKEKKILQIKKQIYSNNLAHRKKENRLLFQELKEMYGVYGKEKKERRDSSKKLRLCRPVLHQKFHRRNKKRKKKRLLRSNLVKNSSDAPLRKVLQNSHEFFQRLIFISNDELKRAQQRKRQSDREEER